jgi:pentatricopeptide repeat protein
VASSSSAPPKTLLYNAMLRGYLSLGLPLQAATLFRDMGAARRVFDEMPRWDTVAWNAVIGGYIPAGCLGEVVGLFNHMRYVDGAQPTEATLVSLISGYGDLGSWEDRGMVHAIVVKYGFHYNLFACNALLEMYAEFGCLNEAVAMFRHMAVKDSITWSSMIGGLARNGKPDYAIKLFHWIVSKLAVVVTRSILLNVFMACAESGD